MNIRKLLLDVDKAIKLPSIIEIGEAINKEKGVEAFTIDVSEIDLETVGMNITIEGQHLDYKKLEAAIEKTGAVVHSIDLLAAGTRIIAPIERER
jgi:uncharacterized protein